MVCNIFWNNWLIFKKLGRKSNLSSYFFLIIPFNDSCRLWKWETHYNHFNAFLKISLCIRQSLYSNYCIKPLITYGDRSEYFCLYYITLTRHQKSEAYEMFGENTAMTVGKVWHTISLINCTSILWHPRATDVLFNSIQQGTIGISTDIHFLPPKK